MKHTLQHVQGTQDGPTRAHVNHIDEFNRLAHFGGREGKMLREDTCPFYRMRISVLVVLDPFQVGILECPQESRLARTK